MWLIPTKKEVKKEFDKISKGFKERDNKIEKLQQKLNEIEQKIILKKEIELMIKEYALSVKSEPNYKPNSELSRTKPNQTNYERVMIRKAIKSRPEALKQAIRGHLERGLRTTDIYNLIVLEKKLISKTQFYHYLGLVRTELRTKDRTELRTKLN